MGTETEQSLAELMQEAFRLSLLVAYATVAPDGSFFDVRDLPDDEFSNKVFGWADGLMHKFYHKHANGQCSLQATIDFDVAEFEREIRQDIAVFTAKLAELGEPRKLTFAEMRARGYRGAWAGMNDAGEIVNP